MKKNISIKILKTLTLFIVAFSLSNCASKIAYEDATETETVSIDFGSTDLQITAEKMVDSLLSFPPVVDITSKRRPVMFVDSIKNKTTEHIDTESITDTIQTKVLRSGKFRFVDMTKVESVRKQLEFQQKSGMVRQDTAVALSRQIGAEYMLYGNLSSIVKRGGKVKDVYYKFTMKLMHLESGIVEWQDEKEIRKQKKRSTFGL